MMKKITASARHIASEALRKYVHAKVAMAKHDASTIIDASSQQYSRYHHAKSFYGLV